MAQDSSEAETVGLLYIDSRQHMHTMTGLDRKILTRLADEAGRAIEKLEMIAAAEERRKLSGIRVRPQLPGQISDPYTPESIPKVDVEHHIHHPHVPGAGDSKAGNSKTGDTSRYRTRV